MGSEVIPESAQTSGPELSQREEDTVLELEVTRPAIDSVTDSGNRSLNRFVQIGREEQHPPPPLSQPTHSRTNKQTTPTTTQNHIQNNPLNTHNPPKHLPKPPTLTLNPKP